MNAPSSKDIVFGNKKSQRVLTVGPSAPIRFLCNVGHMDISETYEAEQKKVEIAFKHGIDIIADNTITEKRYEFMQWIKHNFPMMLNTVPIYECFPSMQNRSFCINQLLDILYQHIENGADMIVMHPGINQELSRKISESSRTVKVTSRGGSQLYRYIKDRNIENPYFEYWKDICKILEGSGVAIAIGLSLRAGSVIDDLSPLYLDEMDNVGKIIEQARPYNIPIVVEGVGHTQAKNIPVVLSEIKARCHDVPIKTLGPLVSDRMLSEEHINALIGGTIAATSGASIIGTLFRSEHIGQPNIDDYEESLKYYQILKYSLNMSNEQLEIERKISESRAKRQWHDILKYAFFEENAYKFFSQRHKDTATGTCTMCGERCALLENLE